MDGLSERALKAEEQNVALQDTNDDLKQQIFFGQNRCAIGQQSVYVLIIIIIWYTSTNIL
jgi:hypothetical protein